MASRTKTQWAKPEDWERYRNTITALFMCHSLPVVMRIMREEHQFHATPKMFQSQIYQKWGLRKTKPGEAKKEAKEAKARKRLREESEEVESVASSRSRAPVVAEDLSVSGRSAESTSPTGPAPWQAASDDANTTLDPLDHQVPASLTSRGMQPPIIQESFDPQALVPQAWTNFLNQGSGPLPQPNDHQTASAPSVPQSLNDGEQFFPQEGTVHPSSDSGSWISTVMLPTAPTSVANSYTQAPQSTKSGSSESSSGSRPRASPSRQGGASSPRFRNKQSMARVKTPMGSIRHLAAPRDLLVPERTMFYARHFISNRFSTGLWALSQSSDPTFFDSECGKLERWYNDFNPGFDCLRARKVKRAFRLLKRCFANTKTIIEPQDPRVIIYVCQQATRCMWYDELGRNLSQTLLKYISGLCQVFFGMQHPLFIMLDQLARMDSFQFAHTLRPFMDCYFDHLEPFLEQSSNAFGHITEMRGLTVSLMEATGMMGIYEAKPVLDGLVEKAELHGLPSLYLKVETAALLHRNRFFSEALSLLTEVRESPEAPLYPYEFHYAGIVWILTLQKMKDIDGAIRAEYELVNFLSRPLSHFPGYPDQLTMSLRQFIEARQSTLLLILGKLEKDLRESGRIEEAEKIQARLDRGVTQEYGAEEPNGDPEAEVNAMVEHHAAIPCLRELLILNPKSAFRLRSASTYKDISALLVPKGRSVLMSAMSPMALGYAPHRINITRALA
ncbi:hypothetical protein JX266_007056 [Neoarthrinium moseri]|nr:hypothetical protein JX266_007056 [Neoarthrinium moseri]